MKQVPRRLTAVEQAAVLQAEMIEGLGSDGTFTRRTMNSTALKTPPRGPNLSENYTAFKLCVIGLLGVLRAVSIV